MTQKTETPGIGHNKPPVENLFDEVVSSLLSTLEEDCGDIITRANELAENAREVPSKITTVEEEANVTDIISQINKHIKVADSRRLGIKAGPRKAGEMIDGFFKTRAIDLLEKEVARISPVLTIFKREKAEKERREREEKERLAREEAERQRRAAEEAERARREAEERRLRAEREAKEAEERKARAEQEAREAEQRRKKAEQDRIEAERRAKEAKDKEAKERAEREAREAQERAKREENEKRRAAEEAERARQASADAKTEKSLAKAELADANREMKTATALSKAADKDVVKAERASNAKASELSGVRGDYGGHSSLRTVWVGLIQDRRKLLKDAEAIWDFIPEADLQKAVNAYVKVHKGSGKLRGVNIFEDTGTTVR